MCARWFPKITAAEQATQRPRSFSRRRNNIALVDVGSHIAATHFNIRRYFIIYTYFTWIYPLYCAVRISCAPRKQYLTSIMSSSDTSPTLSFSRTIKFAFRSRRRSTGSKSASSAGSPPTASSVPPAPAAVPIKTPSSSPTTSTAALSLSPASLFLASRNYPHVHIKEMVYEACSRIPKHSYEESVTDCTCGKRAVDRYREMCGLKDAECPGCKFGFDEPQEESDDDYYY